MMPTPSPTSALPSYVDHELAMIDIKNISKWYGTFQVLTDRTGAAQCNIHQHRARSRKIAGKFPRIIHPNH